MPKKIIKLEEIDSTDIENSGFEIVRQIWISYPDYRNSKKSESEEEFVNNFFIGYFNRPSKRKGNPQKTKSDPLIEIIVKARLGISDDEAALYTKAHRIEMCVENVIGSILEEYIHCKVVSCGWSCCWGSVLKAMDFCSSEGLFLQMKNKFNTENSSSDKIRLNTPIEKWFRLKSNGDTNWDELNLKMGISDESESRMSETDFRDFARNLIVSNPELLNIE